MRKSDPECEGGANDAEGGEHEEEEVMPHLMRKMSESSVSGMSTVTMQPSRESCKSKVVVIPD